MKKRWVSYLALLSLSLSVTSCDLEDFFNGLNKGDQKSETASFLDGDNNSSFNFGEDFENNGGINDTKTGGINQPDLDTGSTNNPTNPTQPKTKVSDIENIYFANPSIEVSVGTPTGLGLVIYPATAKDRNISYIISDESYGTISSDGVLTATKSGEFEVSAKTSSGITAECSVVAKDSKPQEVEVTNIYFKNSDIKVTVGTPTTLEVEIEPSNATDKELEFTISDGSYGSVSSDGVLTATKSGQFTVSAKTCNGITATCNVTAIKPITSISFKNPNMQVTVGISTLLEVDINPSDATDKELEFTISDGSYGSVSSDGILTATRSGEFKVTARTSNGITAICNITATDPEPEVVEVTNIYFKNPSIQVIKGIATTLEVEIEPSNATDKELEFSISDFQYGSITNKGVLTATKSGEFIVTARAKNGVSASCSVTSGAGPVTSISMDPIDLTIGEDNEKTISYTFSPLDATNNIRYYIPSSPYVAEIYNNKVKGYKAGHTSLILYDDVNKNKALDSNEYRTSVDICVHDYTEVTNTVEPTCYVDGSITKTCGCGCGKTKTETIPARSHDIEEIIIKKPTCTDSGTKKLRCKHTNCSYEKEETVSAYGGSHTPSKEKDTSMKFLASRGNVLNRSQYYYKCSRCGEKTNSKYTYGNHDDFSNNSRLESCLGSAGAANNFKKELNAVIGAYKEYRNKSFESSFRVNFDKSWGGASADRIMSLQCTAATFGEGFPYVHWNRATISCIYNDNVLIGFREKSADGYESVEKRNQDFPTYFDAINNEIDPLIRDEATDAEKALIISLYTAKYFSYNAGSYFYFSSIKNKKANCSGYSSLVCYLANRFNLPCIYSFQEGKTHGWNNISIDGKWYTFDVTNSDCNMEVLFCGKNPTSITSTTNSLLNLVNSDTPSIRNNLMQLYKNGEFAGIYYNLDTVLSKVDDSSADYKIVLGIGYDGVQGLSLSDNKSYFLSNYEANTSSIKCKSLTFERCKTNSSTKPTVTLPSNISLLNSISSNNVSIKNK